VAALFLDGEGTGNWIVPVQLLVMALVGALVTLALPALARADGTAARAITGAGWGLLAAVAGVLVFWLLLNGSGGA
jgi:hypothetical protein